MTPVGVFFIYPNEDKLGFVNSAKLGRIFKGAFLSNFWQSRSTKAASRYSDMCV